MTRAHGNRVVLEMFRTLERLGFSITRKRNGGYVITPPTTSECQTKYHTHGTAKCILPMKRDIAKMYGIKVD